MIDDHERRCDLVLDAIDEVVTSAVPPGRLAHSVADLLAGVAQSYRSSAPDDVVAVHVPLAFAGDREPAAELVGVAAACTALHIGGRLLDDLMDGHEISYFREPRGATEVLGWATFLSIMPPLLLARIQVAAERRVRLIDRFSSGMALMASGQLGDVSFAGDLPSRAEAMAAVEGKSGALLACFAGCAATVIGLDDGEIAAAERGGRALGVARQLIHDGAKVVAAGTGERPSGPLPVTQLACLAEAVDEHDRAEIVRLAAAAATDPSAGDQLRRRMIESGSAAVSALEAEFMIASAIAAFEKLPDTIGRRLTALTEA